MFVLKGDAHSDPISYLGLFIHMVVDHKSDNRCSNFSPQFEWQQGNQPAKQQHNDTTKGEIFTFSSYRDTHRFKSLQGVPISNVYFGIKHNSKYCNVKQNWLE